MNQTLTKVAAPNQLSNTIQELSTSLQSLAPTSSDLKETTQIINYALIATAVVGLFIYHYIKQQEKC